MTLDTDQRIETTAPAETIAKPQPDVQAERGHSLFQTMDELPASHPAPSRPSAGGPAGNRQEPSKATICGRYPTSSPAGRRVLLPASSFAPIMKIEAQYYGRFQQFC